MNNLAVRLITAALVSPLLLAIIYLAPQWGFLILIFAATTIAASELVAMTMPGRRLQQAWGIAASVAVLAVVYFQPSPLAIVTGLLGLLVLGFLFGLAAPDPLEAAGPRMAWLVAGPIYTGATLATVALLRLRDNGGSWVVLVLMLAWLGDTGGYFAGRAFGRHKLYPKVSPKKTVEGSVGGLLGSMTGALVAHFWLLPELPLVQGLLLALVAGALGQAGDLMASLVKRSTGVKDSGWIIPGHGGILDRIDALMLTGTTTWLYTAWILDR